MSGFLDCYNEDNARDFNEEGTIGDSQYYSSFFLRAMRYSLRRALSLDSVNRGTHNPTIGSSNPGPTLQLPNCLASGTQLQLRITEKASETALFD
jgi:hypothetical protein